MQQYRKDTTTFIASLHPPGFQAVISNLYFTSHSLQILYNNIKNSIESKIDVNNF